MLHMTNILEMIPRIIAPSIAPQMVPLPPAIEVPPMMAMGVQFTTGPGGAGGDAGEPCALEQCADSAKQPTGSIADEFHEVHANRRIVRNAFVAADGAEVPSIAGSVEDHRTECGAEQKHPDDCIQSQELMCVQPREWLVRGANQSRIAQMQNQRAVDGHCAQRGDEGRKFADGDQGSIERTSRQPDRQGD